MIVTNTTPLINLGRFGKISILREIFNRVLIPEEVYREIMQLKDSLEALAVQKAIQNGWIKTEKITPDLQIGAELLDEGEKEAITLALKNNCIFLTDDDHAKKFAIIQSLEVHGTIYVLIKAAAKRIISKEEAKSLLDKMISSRFYVSTEIYAKFLDALSKI